MIDALIFSGLQTIRKWTKESLLEKPFSTAKGKIWTENPSDTPLDDIYTKLRLVKKTRSKDRIKIEELSEFTQLLSQEMDGPVRVLATGYMFNKLTTYLFGYLWIFMVPLWKFTLHLIYFVKELHKP